MQLHEPTVDELAYLATQGQSSKVYAIFVPTPTVYTALVNQTFTSYDKRAWFNYDTGSGTLANVKPGMTVLIGSTAGASDRGITYIRKTPTSSRIYIGEQSDVQLINNSYVTVLWDFSVWPEHLTITSDNTAAMKYDVTYTDQHKNKKPVPILGPDRVAKLVGASVVVTFDASDSYAPGSTVASHLFTCSGGTFTGGSAATASPVLTFTATGTYRLTYTVTAANGQSTTTYRTIHVWNASSDVQSAAVISGFNWAKDTGGSLTIKAHTSITTVRDRSKVIVFEEGWYGNTQISLGQYEGAENILMVGWVDGETLNVNTNAGDVSFTLRGPAFWLRKDHNFIPWGIENTTTDPTAWTQMKDATTDMILWHFIMWQTTLTNCVDVYLTGDTRKSPGATVEAGSLWQQITSFSNEAILAEPMFDLVGSLFFQIPVSLTSEVSRESLLTTSTFDHDDWSSVEIDRNITTPVSWVNLSGVAWDSGTLWKAHFALAPGHIPSHYGDPITPANLLLSGQAQAEELAGQLYAWRNAPLVFNVKGLMANNRLFGICPAQRVILNVLAADTPRGIAYNGPVHIDSITYNHSAETNVWSIDFTATQETHGGLSSPGDIPIIPDPPDPDPIDPDPWTPYPIPWTPPWQTWPVLPPDPIPSVPVPCGDASEANGPIMLASNRSWVGGDPDASLRVAVFWYLCTIRSSTATHQTTFTLEYANRGKAYEHLHLYAINGAEGVLATAYEISSGVVYGNVWRTVWGFNVSPALDVAGFKLECDEGFDVDGSPLTLVGSSVDSTIVNAGTASISSVATQMGTNVVQVAWTSAINESSPYLANQCNALVNMSWGVYNTPMYAWVYFNPITGGSGNRININVNNAGVPLLDWQEGPYLRGVQVGTTGSFLSGARSVSIDNKPDAQTGLFSTRGVVYYSLGTNFFRSAAFNGALLYNVCPAT